MDSGWPLSYARVSMDGQDFTARTDALIAVGVATDRVFTQKGHGEYSVRSAGVDSVLAARRPGDALVVTKLDRLARSLRNATDRREKLASSWARLIIDGAVCSPTDTVSRFLLYALGFVAESESDLPAARRTTVIPVPTRFRRWLRGRVCRRRAAPAVAGFPLAPVCGYRSCMEVVLQLLSLVANRLRHAGEAVAASDDDAAVRVVFLVLLRQGEPHVAGRRHAEVQRLPFGGNEGGDDGAQAVQVVDGGDVVSVAFEDCGDERDANACAVCVVDSGTHPNCDRFLRGLCQAT